MRLFKQAALDQIYPDLFTMQPENWCFPLSFLFLMNQAPHSKYDVHAIHSEYLSCVVDGTKNFLKASSPREKQLFCFDIELGNASIEDVLEFYPNSDGHIIRFASGSMTHCIAIKPNSDGSFQVFDTAPCQNLSAQELIDCFNKKDPRLFKTLSKLPVNYPKFQLIFWS